MKLRKNNEWLQQLKVDILEAARAYYEPEADEEPLFSDHEYDMLVRQLYRATYLKVSHYENDTDHSPVSKHYAKWLEHMASKFGWGFK